MSARHRCFLPHIFDKGKTRDCVFSPRRRARFGETTPSLHQADHKREPKPREKPACSKTPLHAAKKLPTCQPLWQPHLAHLQPHASQEATSALLTSFAHRYTLERRAVTTAKAAHAARGAPSGRRSPRTRSRARSSSARALPRTTAPLLRGAGRATRRRACRESSTWVARP